MVVASRVENSFGSRKRNFQRNHARGKAWILGTTKHTPMQLGGARGPTRCAVTCTTRTSKSRRQQTQHKRVIHILFSHGAKRTPFPRSTRAGKRSLLPCCPLFLCTLALAASGLTVPSPLFFRSSWRGGVFLCGHRGTQRNIEAHRGTQRHTEENGTSMRNNGTTRSTTAPAPPWVLCRTRWCGAWWCVVSREGVILSQNYKISQNK